VHEAQERHRPAADGPERSVGDGEVVADDVALRDPSVGNTTRSGA